MDTETIEFMLFLKNNASELRSYGLKQGLSPEEINACIDKALSTNNNTETRNETRQTWRRKFKILSTICLVIFIVVLCLTILVYTNRTSRVLYKELSQSIRDVYSYDFNRFMRLVLLPLHNFFHIRAYYYAECLFPNPWFEPQRNCEMCEDVLEVAEMKRPHWPIVRRHCQDQRPFVVRASTDTKTVRFEDLVEMYNQHKVTMDNSMTDFVSNDPDFTNISQVFNLRTDRNLQKENELKIKWTTSTMSSSQTLRKNLFPRPHFIPNNYEVSLQKTLFINGPDSQPVEIGIFGMFAEVVFYVQIIKGKSEVDVIPQGACGDYCSTLQVGLNEGDTLVFEQHLWKVDIYPSNETETSIIFAGSFVP